MKKLLYLGIVLMLASCGSEGLSKEQIKEEERMRMEAREELEKEKNSSTAVIGETGEEISTIKINHLEVMMEDMEVNSWHEAMSIGGWVGDGWRLPTKRELNMLYENKWKITGFTDDYYWSSEEIGYDYAGLQGFSSGRQDKDIKVISIHRARLVRGLSI